MYDKFYKSLKLLEEQHTRLSNATNTELEPWVIEAIKESCIQRFETCWDSLWKVLKRYLQHNILIPEVPNGPNPILRLAAENNLIFEIEKWLIYAKARVSTAHDYSEEKADGTLSILEDFISDAINLYERLSETKWN